MDDDIDLEETIERELAELAEKLRPVKSFGNTLELAERHTQQYLNDIKSIYLDLKESQRRGKYMARCQALLKGCFKI